MSLLEKNRREAQRFITHLRITVKQIELFTTNISVSGMQVICPNMLLGILQAELDKEEVDVVMFLPDQIPGQENIEATCQIAYLSDESDETLIGLDFLKFKNGGFSVFHQFLRTLEASAKH